tara:strand:+ start:2754 stop:4145 length:1392 start_codon:yes stop_codon:yes gene_type:complete
MSKHKLGVCVPYRNREAHLNEFIPKVAKYLKSKDIDFQMYFAHQDDDKLFNRGATKNIAAEWAFKEGCDYIVWHDIDMIPVDNGGADYSFPKEHPRHIATKISQMDWKLKYHEYFGGAVLFSKEHALQTNGYSNNYWDWGMEDDDLFWRCHIEGLTNDTYLTEFKEHKYYRFNGKTSKLKIPFQRKYRGITGDSHTVSILCKCYHKLEENNIFLIGDKNNKYVEYPIFRIPGWEYGISFNNSRAVSLQYWNTFNQHNYMWIKRYDKQWTWITVVFNAKEKTSHFYINGTEADSKAGHGSPSPHRFLGKLKKYNREDWWFGHSITKDTYFKGDIAKAYVWDRDLQPGEVEDLHINIPNDYIYNLEEDFGEGVDLHEITEDFKVPNSIIPHRVEGKLRCLPHKDEGLVNGSWAKGETTAANERRYVLQMQQNKLNHKQDGLNTLKYNLKSVDQLTPFAKMINITL